MSAFCRHAVTLATLLLTATSAAAQMPASGPPVVGVASAVTKPVTETTEINGRVQAIGKVDLVARVTAFLDEKLFVEGAEVKKGDVLFRLERPPYEAEVEARRAAVAQAEAQLENAKLTLGRAQELVKTATTSQATLDNARASQLAASAQLKSAQAQLHQAQINLDYTEIHAPIDGRIGRVAVTVGNVVGPSSGPLATVVSQDPIYVTFPVSVRRYVELREKFATGGGFDAVRLRLRLPDGRLYGSVGTLQFVDINVARDTDSITLRGTIPNPVLPRGGRELTNDEMVRVVIETVAPRMVLAVPRVAVLTDQRGDYVYVVGDKDIARQRRVTLGQSTAAVAAITDGLNEGERVVVDGVQRVRPDTPVSPVPAAETVFSQQSSGRS